MNALQIPLVGSERVALVDAEDHPKLSGFRWYLHSGRYARARVDGRMVFMHTLVVRHQEGFELDHLNRDGLDNRKSNLRYATRAQNLYNRISRNPLGFKGVKRTKAGTFKACVRPGNHLICTRCFRSLEEAAHAYDDLARLHFGEFAHLNFPDHAAAIGAVL